MTNAYYNYTDGQPVALSRGSSAAMRTEFQQIAAGFDSVSTALSAKGAVTGQTWTGIHDFTGGEVKVGAPQSAADAVPLSYLQAQVISGALPTSPSDAGKFAYSNGTNVIFRGIDGLGAAVADKGNTGAVAQTINYTDGEGQTITATGNHSLTTTGWPSGRIAGVLLRMVNYGNFTLTTTGIVWIKADKSQTTDFSQSGITLPASGSAFVVLFSYGDGIVYGKAA